MLERGMVGFVIAGLSCTGCGSDAESGRPAETVQPALPPGSQEIPASDARVTPEATRRPELPDAVSISLPDRMPAVAPGTPGAMSPNLSPNMSPDAPAISPAVPPGSSALGGRCTSTLQCESGLLCLGNPANPTLFEAVPGGYCSVPCQQDAECTRLGSGSSCDRLGFCTAPCDVNRDVTASDAAKCGGRLDELNCFGNRTVGGGCLSSCANDEVCGPGRECYYGSGTCLLIGRSEVLFNNAPIGAACAGDILSSIDEFSCRGYCFTNGADTASLCSGVCTVGGTGCGGDVSNLCVPLFIEGRHGDRGTCYQTCRGSSDCAPGQGECVPSGIASASGERLAYCQPLRASVPTPITQRLSVEDLRSVVLPGVEFVQSYTSGSVNSQLSNEDGQVCITGDVPDLPEADTSLAHLSFHFGLIDPPTPRDVSTASALNITMTSDRGMYLFATLMGRPGTEYGTFVLTPPQNQTFQFAAEELRGAQVGSLPWDATLLDTVGFRLASGAGPFRLCVSHVAFE